MHADIAARLLQDDPDVVPQLYHGKVPGAGTGRRAQSQQYMPSPSLSFLSAQDAHAAGLTQGIRIQLVWDVVLGRDFVGGTHPRQCRFPGDTVQLQQGGTWSGCADEDVVDPASSDCVSGGLKCRHDVMLQRTEWAARTWASGLYVKPVQDNITVSTTFRSRYNLEGAQSYANTDLVVIMTARPEPGRSIAAYAACLQRDQYGRCTVGLFNWVPAVFDVASQRSPETISNERTTALHELVHIFGGMSVGRTGSTPFIDDAGNMRDISELLVTEQDGPGYPKVVTKVRTPRVLDMVRQHFGCPTMTGMPLEDLPLAGGYASHWEARLMGPEVMSYGSGSGEGYLSDLTLAFLEDTNQYVANYSIGGRLLAATDDTDNEPSLGIGFLRTKSTKDAYEPPAPRSPGALRWGRGAGCSFVTGNARDWPDRYRCHAHQDYGCSFGEACGGREANGCAGVFVGVCLWCAQRVSHSSPYPDNRMSSVCSLRVGLSVPETYSCGGYNAATGAGECNNRHPSCTGSDCPLPHSYQAFDATTARQAAGNNPDPSRLGGWSDAMDFAPVGGGRTCRPWRRVPVDSARVCCGCLRLS